MEMAGGNLLVGKSTQTNTTYKIDVAGKIRSDEIVVNSNGADFVFDPGYELTDLDRLEAYVHAHRHLPGMASAAEMQREGLSVGETTTKLLQKIEELTLYIIELKKENAAHEASMQRTNKVMLEKIEKLTLIVEAQKQIEHFQKENK